MIDPVHLQWPFDLWVCFSISHGVFLCGSGPDYGVGFKMTISSLNMLHMCYPTLWRPRKHAIVDYNGGTRDCRC